MIHQTAVALSVTGFFARGLASLFGADWVRGRLARTLPHIIDSVLLVSAMVLAWMLRLTPDAAPWLMAKIAGLLLKSRSVSWHCAPGGRRSSGASPGLPP